MSSTASVSSVKFDQSRESARGSTYRRSSFHGRSAGQQVCLMRTVCPTVRMVTYGRTMVDAVLDTVAAAWREVLGRDVVGPDDDFYALGGDSLGAVRIVGRLQETLGVDVSVRAVLECRTVRGMAERVGAALPASTFDDDAR